MRSSAAHELGQTSSHYTIFENIRSIWILHKQQYTRIIPLANNRISSWCHDEDDSSFLKGPYEFIVAAHDLPALSRA